jgi:plastocyanin
VKIRSKKLWAGTLAVGAAGALGLTFMTSAAPAEQAQRGTPTITMERDGNQLYFSGPETIEPGQTLRIVNNTNPQQIGPHTFSLTQDNIRPKTIGQFKACGKAEPGTACRKVFKAHEVDFEKEKVGKKVADFGKEGWNLMFRKQGSEGDSWFALKENASYEAQVSAKPGKTLTYFCAIHPDMQGEIQVTNQVK